MSLTHTLYRDGTTLVLRLAGHFCLADNNDFRNLIDEVAAASPATVTVDLSELLSIDSAGLSMLIQLRDRLCRVNACLRLCYPPPSIDKVFIVVSFDKIFTIVR